MEIMIRPNTVRIKQGLEHGLNTRPDNPILLDAMQLILWIEFLEDKILSAEVK